MKHEKFNTKRKKNAPFKKDTLGAWKFLKKWT
jgi:hypothetical protein